MTRLSQSNNCVCYMPPPINNYEFATEYFDHNDTLIDKNLTSTNREINGIYTMFTYESFFQTTN